MQKKHRPKIAPEAILLETSWATLSKGKISRNLRRSTIGLISNLRPAVYAGLYRRIHKEEIFVIADGTDGELDRSNDAKLMRRRLDELTDRETGFQADFCVRIQHYGS